MNKLINILALIMTTSCSTYSVTCLHNEASSAATDVSPDEDTQLHTRSKSVNPHVVIKTNEKRNTRDY